TAAPIVIAAAAPIVRRRVRAGTLLINGGRCAAERADIAGVPFFLPCASGGGWWCGFVSQGRRRRDKRHRCLAGSLVGGAGFGRVARRVLAADQLSGAGIAAGSTISSAPRVHHTRRPTRGPHDGPHSGG